MSLHRNNSSRDASRTWFVNHCNESSKSCYAIIGAVHEHSRPDRDSHVSILFENIQPGAEKNFRKVGNGTHSARGTPFDLESIMFYGPTDFGIIDSTGKRKTTIEPLRPGYEIRQVLI